MDNRSSAWQFWFEHLKFYRFKIQKFMLWVQFLSLIYSSAKKYFCFLNSLLYEVSF